MKILITVFLVSLYCLLMIGFVGPVLVSAPNTFLSALGLTLTFAGCPATIIVGGYYIFKQISKGEKK